MLSSIHNSLTRVTGKECGGTLKLMVWDLNISNSETSL
jgi:hypothetical protein